MGVSSHGHCIVGFGIREENLVDLEELGLKCPSCGPRSGKFCSDCGKATRIAFKRTWNDRALALSKHFNRPLRDELYDTSWFEDFDHCMVKTDDWVSLGVLLPPNAYTKTAIEEAFEKAHVLAKIVFPDNEVPITLWWGHEIS